MQLRILSFRNTIMYPLALLENIKMLSLSAQSSQNVLANVRGDQICIYINDFVIYYNSFFLLWEKGITMINRLKCNVINTKTKIVKLNYNCFQAFFFVRYHFAKL